ncbi:MAG: DUF4142 domain-containing protein [Pseudomonadota bacterium]
MKAAPHAAAALIALTCLSACGKPATKSESAAEPAPVTATQDAVGAAVGQTSAATLGANDTDAFVSNASQSDMYEIEAAKLAQTRSKNPDVVAFAKMMVVQHTAMTNQMKPLILAANKTPAAALDQRRQGFLDNLKSASDAAFDKTYVDQQVAAHQEALTLMKGYAEHGDDAGLKGGAAKAVPKIESHLAEAQKLQSGLS